MIRILVLVLCSLLVPLAAEAAGTYHVARDHPNANDANACANNQNLPRRTIAAGQQCLQGPGDTLYVHQGDYRPQSVGYYYPDRQFPSGSAAAPILIAVWPGDSVTVGGMGADTWNGGAIQHVILDGFKTDGQGHSGIGISGYHSDYITVRNCEIKNHFGSGIEGYTRVNGSHHGTVQRCHIHHNGQGYLDHGFYWLMPDSLIEDNDIHDNSGYGIQFYSAESSEYISNGDRSIIRNNRIWNNAWANDGGSGQATINTSTNLQFYNNLVYKNRVNGLNNGGGGFGRGLSNSSIYNNTFYGFQDPALAWDRVGTGNAVRNNIFSNNSIDINRSGEGAGTIYGTNLCGSTDSGTGCTGGNPQFENAGGGNFKITFNSPAKNAGAPLTSVSMSYAGPPDYTSLPRPQPQNGGAWDIGAYEYPEGGPPPFDFTIPTPSAISVARSASVTVPVSATLSSGTAASVSWSTQTLPSGVSSSFTGSPCTPSCTANMTLTATAGATLGTFTNPVVVGTSGSLVHTAPLNLTVTAPTSTFDFSIGNPGDQTVQQGASITVPLALSLLAAPATPVTLTVTSALPSGVSASFSNTPCTPSCTATLTLTASDTATTGTTPLTVHGVGGTQSKDLTMNLTVTNIISSANPIYVRGGPGSASNSCIAAENPATAKKTIGDACSCMTIAGKVMYIEGNGNTYVEKIDTGGGICPITGGNGPSMDTATRLEGYGTPLPVIQSPVGAAMALHLRGSGDKYLIFTKLVFDAANHADNVIAVFPTAHHVRFQEVEVKNTAGGFEPLYLQAASNIELVDVSIHDAGTHALMLDGTISNFLCQRCHLFNASQVGLNVNSSGTKTNLTLDALEVRNNGGVGVDLGASTGTAIQNMISRSNGGVGLVIRAGASGTRVYNSTIYGNTGLGLQCEIGAPSTQIRNTIMNGNTGGNLQNNCGATVSSNLEAAPAPVFVSAPGNLHLAPGSPGIDQGEAIPSILTDYDGQPRQQGQQDIGAYETTSVTPPAGQDVTVRPRDLAQAAWYF
jgi:Right handed beta helix region